MKDNNVYLKHILEAIQNIDDYINGLNFNLFSGDKKTVDAVVRELEIIGEAANNLSDKFKNSYPEIPFRDMIDMRNVLIHEYFGVNKKVVWDTCKENLPKLKEIVEETLKSS
ncbi:MAG: DUF86 domain-containing protein [Candidatus Brennerbacteria bacterium]|nr:DUF86 domain-containing protein [Candidatus Brennerbacteria bacterium]